MTLWVALDDEVRPGWLSRWRETGDTIGTSDDTRAVYQAAVDAGTTILGDAGRATGCTPCSTGSGNPGPPTVGRYPERDAVVPV